MRFFERVCVCVCHNFFSVYVAAVQADTSFPSQPEKSQVGPPPAGPRCIATAAAIIRSCRRDSLIKVYPGRRREERAEEHVRWPCPHSLTHYLPNSHACLSQGILLLPWPTCHWARGTQGGGRYCFSYAAPNTNLQNMNFLVL